MSDYWSEVDPDDSAWERSRQESELLEWEQEVHVDRLRRDWPVTTRRLCAVCGERVAAAIFGMKCQPCFEAQREEREAA